MIINFGQIKNILQGCQVVAVVGLSPKKSRPSNEVAVYMQQNGYRIIPVNPGQDEILGEICYPDLHSIPIPVDVVNIFRRSELVEPVVADAIKIGARVIWMQQGIVNEDAAMMARKAGLTVIMDRCIKVDHQGLLS